MNSAHTCIEDGYGDLFKYFLLLDQKKKFRMYKNASVLHALVMVRLFVKNIHTCYNGDKIQRYFGVNKYTIDEYLSLDEILEVIDWE